MIEDIKPYLEHVKGNTDCIVTGYARIPLYRLDEHRVILIDSGLPKDHDAIVALLEKENLHPVAILTSHTHPDHIGNHVALRQRYGAPIYMTAFHAAVCREPMNMYATLQGGSGFRAMAKQTGRFFDADHIMDWNGESVTVEGATFQLIRLPGHCAEHLGFITPDDVAYLGDTVLSPEISQALRLPYCVGVELDLASKQQIAELECDKYIFAHNGVYDCVRDICQINRDTVLRRLDTLEELVDSPMTLDELVRKFLVLNRSDLSSRRGVMGVHNNAAGCVAYLVDTGRLELRIEDGFIKYVRRDAGKEKT